MKGKGSKPNWSLKMKLGLPTVIFSCSFFFLAGLFGSTLLSLENARPRSRLLESINEEEIEFDLLPHGESGDGSISSIPFQILSWEPRALYFPNFATAEQCQSIIGMVESKLKPSTLALRAGETEENTKGIRTSSGTFISASEDKSGILAAVEEKIARATMLPRSHGEGNSKIL